MSEADVSLYFYDPSLPTAAVFTVLYAIPTIYLLYTTIIGPRTGKYNHAKFFIPLCIGGVMEVAGYATRCISVKNPRSIPLFATSNSLVVIAPVCFCASLYLLVGRLIRAGIPKAGKQQNILGISPRFLPGCFFASDILSFMTQGSGSAIASSGNWEGSSKETGTNVLIGGLALQLVTFSLYLVILQRFHVRAKAFGAGVTGGVRKVLVGMYIAGFFIELRSIYRLVEFILGIDGYPFRHEWILYVLEAGPMLIALVVLAYYHPGKWLPKETILASQSDRSDDVEAK